MTSREGLNAASSAAGGGLAVQTLPRNSELEVCKMCMPKCVPSCVCVCYALGLVNGNQSSVVVF